MRQNRFMIRQLFALCAPVFVFAALHPPAGPRLVETAPNELVAVSGTDDSAVVVIVADPFGGAYAYREVVANLTERGVGVVVVEPLGVGHSSSPRSADYTASAQAARVAQVMDTLGMTSAVVVGHGFAASIGLRVALQRPQRVRGVVSIAGGPMDRPSAEGSSAVGKFSRFSRLPGARRFVRREIEGHLRRALADASRADDALVDAYSRSIPDLGGAVHAMRQASQRADTLDLVSALTRVSHPVRLLVGSARTGTGIQDDEIGVYRRHLPDFEVLVAERSGSLVHEERPDVVAEVITGLVSRSRVVSGRP
jgi:pimeloyl-ACP methyl ester carboxylesterase